MFKGKQYSNNPRTEDDLKENSKCILQFFSLSQEELRRTRDKQELCVLAEGLSFSSTFFKYGE